MGDAMRIAWAWHGEPPDDVSVSDAAQEVEGHGASHQPVGEQEEGTVQGGHVERLGCTKQTV